MVDIGVLYKKILFNKCRKNMKLSLFVAPNEIIGLL